MLWRLHRRSFHKLLSDRQTWVISFIIRFWLNNHLLWQQMRSVVDINYCFVATVNADECNPPCGASSVCRNRVCSCISGYFGDPYRGCRPECVQNSDCLADKACINLKCVDPCAGTCGRNAECTVINHIPICNCIDRHDGDPFTSCNPVAISKFSFAILLCFLNVDTNKFHESPQNLLHFFYNCDYNCCHMFRCKMILNKVTMIITCALRNARNKYSPVNTCGSHEQFYGVRSLPNHPTL